MMADTNVKWIAMTDDGIIKQIGNFIKKTRIAKNKTQAQIAEAAGINRWTVSKMENGESITLSLLIQILRALDALYVLDNFTISKQISPLQAVKLQKNERQRASGVTIKNKSKLPNHKSDW
ncbi:putative transcriptional regulator [Aequorivita sublithincola DSM 14238]|uniref:Putative transcriptional regulator n=1 Tax=Aequorivita sublithincola (strain DSM 14238 / LMG 21431 / ACAM 643 / 9-3) TaxID=746697 RepID=I3YZW9_AEQSU|nr:helix-turn-helix transcriptional regulator [Aequorivita sublithincola]AFL82537.1 putative transcriptional regulator [Aequorivita sublithincola DSM 14238]